MNCHVKRNNRAYAAAQSMEENMNCQQPMEIYPADDTCHSQQLAVSPQMYPAQPGCGCSISAEPAPWPDYDPIQQNDYMQFNGYLRANIGCLMMVEFSCGGLSGDCSMWEKTGVLSEVGDDYIVLSDPNGCGKTCCDLNAIKFVNIMPKECACCCQKPEPATPKPLPAPTPAPAPVQPAETEEHFNRNLYNTSTYNADQYRNYMMP